jgi:hypothetical protein
MDTEGRIEKVTHRSPVYAGSSRVAMGFTRSQAYRAIRPDGTHREFRLMRDARAWLSDGRS